MSTMRIHFEDRASWLAGRMRGIGGSEAAAAVGLSPWQTPLGLWKLKIGTDTQKDLSDNAAVQQGNFMEPILRDFYAATHPEYRVFHFPYDILCQEQRPWLFATLDGELHEESGRIGILEIKTATPNGKVGWEKWSNGQMPEYYFCQVLHQLLATNYDFVRLFSALYSMNGDITLREYEIEREDVGEDLNWLAEKEEEFWRKVQRQEMPGTPLIL